MVLTWQRSSLSSSLYVEVNVNSTSRMVSSCLTKGLMMHLRLLTCYLHCQQISYCLLSRLGESASFCLSFSLVVYLVLLGMVLRKLILLQKYFKSYNCWSNHDNCNSTLPIVLPMVAMMMQMLHMGKWNNLQRINLPIWRHVILVCLRTLRTLLTVLIVQCNSNTKYP